MQNQHQQQDLPLTAWAAIAAAGIAYVTALHFATYWTLAGTAAILIPARFIAWLRH